LELFYHSAYFIGIGGIGMSAIAKYFHSKGIVVSGYDRVKTPLTEELMENGIDIHFEENIERLPKEVDIVVYTPAVGEQHQELRYYRQHTYQVKKRAEVLEEITKDMYTIAVAGSHGKTTVSAMVAHILKHSGYDCTAFLGGITTNYNSNFLLGDNNVVVVEADEFDRSLLRLKPDIAVVTAVDADHLDIYGTKQALEETFAQFAKQVKQDGKVIAKYGLSILQPPLSPFVKGELNVFTYSLDKANADFYAANIHTRSGTYEFDVHSPISNLKGMELNMAGTHNIENMVAAVAVAQTLGINVDKIKAAVADFKGVKRRFEYIIKTPELIFIDDYAHHPVEIKCLLESVRSLYPDKKITIIFQPHLYSRTRDFADGFVESLNLADEVILIDIFPAH